MKTITEQLSAYAAYHRDKRNIATHFIGIPMIVAAVAILLSRPAFHAGGITLSAATVLAMAAVAYYFILDLGFGVIMAALMVAALWLGQWSAAQDTATWLMLGVGGFVVGWTFQFIGHYYEGRKPAFVDDLSGLIIGPLFVVAEALFVLGLYKGLEADIVRHAGALRSAR
ncbi:DUF962 domain-containing protein [Pseudoduganella ginsengisoli]|uniref:DUF962 domain-containing protein n=1 Tax=Pseudoduganella ginsengisoli TaxID=1462440 RepID=A0A6L6Q0Q8_9BURK|nr:Mpo1-like protein [Pseudoduganella ginsengisoli]MTW02612.1 DUF962 domain-containing protein [Pseudoduganella ginsengisoli]